jgi:putative ABC transport system permease protein
VGDRIPIRSDIYAQRDGSFVWDFVVDAIYDNKEKGGDVSSVFLHYDYFDESRTVGKGVVGFYIERLVSPNRSAEIARAIDARFSNSSAETKTGTEKAFVQSFANQTGDIAAIVTSIGIAVFFTMLLVSANTMAQSVRERTNELMVLKTLGFSNPTVLALVIGESLLLTVLGGVLGTAIAMLLVSRLSTTLSQYMSSFLLTPASYTLGVALMLALGLAAGILPAARASRLNIVDGLARH